MAADRYLEFSKFGILVMCPVLEVNVILLYPTKFRVNRIIIRRDISIDDFQNGGRPPF